MHADTKKRYSASFESAKEKLGGGKGIKDEAEQMCGFSYTCRILCGGKKEKRNAVVKRRGAQGVVLRWCQRYHFMLCVVSREHHRVKAGCQFPPMDVFFDQFDDIHSRTTVATEWYQRKKVRHEKASGERHIKREKKGGWTREPR